MLDMGSASILAFNQRTFFGVTLGERIAAAREMAGMNQAELAKAIGVTRSAIQQWESDQTKNLKLANLFAVSRVTGADIYWLGQDSEPPQHAKSLAKFARMPEELQRMIVEQIETLSQFAIAQDGRRKGAA